jgi:hypothetical protein
VKRELSWPKRTLVLLCWLAMAALVVVPPVVARADVPTVTTAVSTRKVEAGEPFSLVLTVSSEEQLSGFSSPAFAAPTGVTVSGPSTQTSTQTRIINGVRADKSSLRVTYTLTAHALGTITLPSPSIQHNGARLSGQPVTVEVVPASGSASGGIGVIGGPGIFGAPGISPQLFPPGPPDFDDNAPEDDSASARELKLPSGPDEIVFLRAIPDKEKAIVGEQVTLSVYLYYRDAYEMTERHDAKYKDFLRFPLLMDPGATTPVMTTVGEKRYGARLVDRVALIPLRSGKLSTGSMSARFNGRKIGARVMKSSNDVTIEVVEPPVDGRPASYALGNVGRFNLTGAVTPRRVKQGGSIGVVLTVDGVGNLPSRLDVPQQKGAIWLAPRTRDNITTKGGRIGGKRTFEYVVRLTSAGTTDLGTVELPFYDPAGGKYETTKFVLGNVEVEEAAPTQAEVDRAKDQSKGSDDPLSKLPDPHTGLAPFEKRSQRLFSPLELGLSFGAAPALALLWMGFAKARQASKNRKDSGSELRSKAKEAIASAKKADASGAPRDVFASVERAIALFLEAKTGIKVRGLRLVELPEKLVAAGVPSELADDAKNMLEECEGGRYVPSPDPEATRELVKRAAALGKKLGA